MQSPGEASKWNQDEPGQPSRHVVAVRCQPWSRAKGVARLHHVYEGGIVEAAVGVGVLLGRPIAILRHHHRILPRQHALRRCRANAAPACLE